MDAMHYYDGGGPTSALDYRHTPHRGYYHGAYHPAFAQSIGLRGRPTAQISAPSAGLSGGGGGIGGRSTPPLYRAVGAVGAIHSQYEGAYRDRYSSESPIPYGATADSRATYGNRMAVSNGHGHGGGGYTGDHTGGGYYGYRADSYRMANEYSQYHNHHAFQQHHQHHHQPPHLQNTPHHPHYHQSTNTEMTYHPQTPHIHGQTPHTQYHPYMNRSVGGYSYSGYPSGAELVYQNTPYQHHHPHHPQHPAFHPHQPFPMARAPSRDLYGAGAAETHSSTAPSSSSPYVYQHSPTTNAIDPLPPTTPSCEADIEVDSLTTTNPTSTHAVPSSSSSSSSSSAPSTSSTKTSPPSANAKTDDHEDIRSTTTNTAEATPPPPAAPTSADSAANGSIFGGNAVEKPAAAPDRATPYKLGGNGSSTLLVSDESRGANCTYPTPPPSTAPADATAYAFSPTSKEAPSMRKSQQRDKHLSKMAAMNRRLEETTAFGTSSILMHERAGTPFAGSSPHHFRDYLTMRTHAYHMQQHHAKYSSYPTMSSQATTMPMSSPWHPISNGTDWMNSPHNVRSNSYYRHHMPTPDSSWNALPAMSPMALTSPSIDSNGGHTSRSSQHAKSVSKVLESDFIPSKKRRRKHSPINGDDSEIIMRREALKKITPLPGFQQAFGSTEIGRFSEVFFNAPESPIEPFGHIGCYVDSEADTLSPQPWETGDSMEGNNFHLPISSGSVQSMYAESYTSTGSPSSSYFSEIRCGDF